MVMTRNFISRASRSLFIVRSDSARLRRRSTSPCVENLEYRLSLSTVGGSVTLRKHDPVAAFVRPADLNPQPLPPGIMVEKIVGNHIGTS
jgi:hypothetical protein